MSRSGNFLCNFVAAPDISHVDGTTYVQEKNQKDSLRRKSKNYLEKSGLLYFRDGKKGTDLQVSVLQQLCKLGSSLVK